MPDEQESSGGGWYRKNAARGAEVRYPPGADDAELKDNLELAWLIADYGETSSTDVPQAAVYEWEVKPPLSAVSIPATSYPCGLIAPGVVLLALTFVPEMDATRNTAQVGSALVGYSDSTVEAATEMAKMCSGKAPPGFRRVKVALDNDRLNKVVRIEWRDERADDKSDSPDTPHVVEK